MTRIFAVAGLLMWAAGAWAEEPAGYQVEIIVFQNRAGATTEEIWPNDPDAPDMRAAVELKTDSTQASMPKAVAPAQYQLAALKQQLNASGQYKTLIHMAWQQPMMEGDAPPVHVQGGPVDGTVTLSRSRYLHVDADLLYRPALAPSGGGPAAAPRTVRLHQSRRMRSQELHYLDHPLFGMLVIATPYGTAASQ